MDEKETQSLGICQKLYNIIMKILAIQSLKTVTLGPQTNNGSAPAPSSGAIHNKVGTKYDQVVHPLAPHTSSKDAVSRAKLGLEKTNTSNNFDPSSSSSSLESSKNGQGVADKAISSPPRVNEEAKSESELSFAKAEGAEGAEEEEATQPMAPKKMVSINDTVEEIHKLMKKRKKSRSFDKSNFANGEDEPRPLRSILKVGSNLGEKTDTSNYQIGC